MKLLRAMLWLMVLASPNPSFALGLDLLATGSPTAGSTITFEISFTGTENVTGYDLTIGWDVSELAFSSAVSGLGSFVVPPSASSPQGARVAALVLDPAGQPAGLLFTISFLVEAVVDDGATDDFRVFVDPVLNGPGVAGAVGEPDPSIENPSGLSADVSSTGVRIVPEPAAASCLLLMGVLCTVRQRVHRTRRRDSLRTGAGIVPESAASASSRA